MEKSKVFDTMGAAERLNIKKQTLYNWRHNRKGPDYVMIGGKPMYCEEDIDRYIDAHKVILN